MLKIICDFSDYKPWGQAVDTYNIIEDNDKIEELEWLLEECYPDGISMVGINDILAFDSEWLLECLGINEDEDEDEDEDEEEIPLF